MRTEARECRSSCQASLAWKDPHLSGPRSFPPSRDSKEFRCARERSEATATRRCARMELVETLLMSLAIVVLGLSPTIYFIRSSGRCLDSLGSCLVRVRHWKPWMCANPKMGRSAKQQHKRRKVHATLVHVAARAHPRPPARVLAEGGAQHLAKHTAEVRAARGGAQANDAGKRGRKRPIRHRARL
jgi:hypothetical protein